MTRITFAIATVLSLAITSVSALLLFCVRTASSESLDTTSQWVVIDQTIEGDVPSTSLLTHENSPSEKTVVHGTLGECEGFISKKFAQFDGFIAVNHPGYYHASFTFSEHANGVKVIRLLACVPFNM